MQNQNLKYLSIQRSSSNRMGININVVERNKIISNPWLFFSRISIIIYTLYSMTKFIADNFNNLLVVSATMTVFNQSCLAVFKTMGFFYRTDKILDLISEINMLGNEAQTDEAKKYWLSENKLSNLVAKIYYRSCHLSAVLYIFAPLALMLYDSICSKEDAMRLPLGGNYSTGDNGTVFFIISYCLAVIFVFSIVDLTVAIDALYCWFIFSISAHFRILRIKIKEAVQDLETASHEQFEQDIHSFVRYHVKVLGFCSHMNDVFGPILFLEVTMSCLQMSFDVYALDNEVDLTNMPFHFMVFVSVTIQLVIYCFGGQKLMDECSKVCTDIYMLLPWHKMTPRQRKLMLLPLMRSQRVSKLRGLFFVVDRNLLVYIFRNAFSFYALIGFMNEKK